MTATPPATPHDCSHDVSVIKISMKPLELEGPSVVKATSPADSESVVKATSRSVVKATSRPSMENDVSFPLKPSSAQDGRSPSSDMEDEEALTPSSALSRIPACPGPLHLLARWVLADQPFVVITRLLWLGLGTLGGFRPP